MAEITKIKSGLLYSDDFKERSLLWTLSPGNKLDQLEFGDNGLIIHRDKDQYLSYTMREPERDYTCIVELDHPIKNLEDIAGVLLFSTPEDYAEAQSLFYSHRSQLMNGQVRESDILRAVYHIMESRYVRWSQSGEELEFIDMGEYCGTDFTSDEYKLIEAIVIDRIKKDTSFVMYDDNDINEVNNLPEQDISYVDALDTDLYKYIKFNKEGHIYNFYASTDRNKWIAFGTTDFDYNIQIGFFNYSNAEKEDVPLNIKVFKITDSQYIEIQNISPNYHIELVDYADEHVYFDSGSSIEEGVISRVDKTMIINTNTLGLPIHKGYIRVYKNDDYHETILKQFFEDGIDPGDKFALNYNLELYVEGHKIEVDDLFNLGTFSKVLDYVEFEIYNNDDDVDADNVIVSVAQYSEYYGGYKEVEIALQEDDFPASSLSYHKSITIPEITHKTGRKLYMRLKEDVAQTPYNAANAYRFKITIS